MVVADLHVHTTNSDGSMTVAELPAAAHDAGVSAIAVTDHDRINPDIEAPVVHRDGVTIVNGIELRVETEAFERSRGRTGRVDLLGYGVRPTERLRTATERLQTDRKERARRIVDDVEAHTGVTLGVDITEGVGRPHIARAIERSDAPYGYDGAFAELIGNDGPCYHAREIPDFETGVALLAEACGLVSLAHPLRYEDPEGALSLCGHDAVDGVEYRYDYGHETDPRPVEQAIEEHELVVTGGSDAHDHTLGRAGLSREEYRAFRDAVQL